MSEITTLTVKISVELKELIKNAAAEAEHSLSAEVAARLEASFTPGAHKGKKAAKATEHDIDNQHLAEESEPALTAKEIKKLRTLINARKASSKKK
ncbi:MAG: hypothetical protein SOI28_01335 [Rahnella inusitata]|jgi:hypothetical protein|uniref:hypothetical protein n=1 Tax=Rahnella inusitata TaxID=58169 RepID=UPI0017E01E06|nr:hypothetical protein [Serratia sp. (in: enterobacteria)]